MGDVDMANTHEADALQQLATPYSDTWAFSDAEQLALRLYDQLHQLELQRSLLEAQQQSAEHAPEVAALSDDALQEQLARAQHEAMEAQAEYEVRNRITHNVLVMDPVLKAVHGAGQTGAAERRLLPLITENDAVSMLHGAHTAKLASTTRALGTAAQANMAVNRENRELARTVLALAEDAKARSSNDIEDARLRGQVDAVDRALREARRRARTMKGVLSAMVVGSGINWAADAGLTARVLAEEEEAAEAAEAGGR